MRSPVAPSNMPRTYTPVPASGTVKIMIVGDSIVAGKYGNNAQDPRGGYRGPLYDRCRLANSRVDFVGSQSATGQGAGSGHEGYPGAGVTTIAGIIADRCATYTPHIILLAIGTNGTNDQDLASDATACAETIVDAIATALPTTLTLVSSTLPFVSPGAKDNYNGQLALEVANRRAAGRYVDYIDMYRQSGLTFGSIDYSDTPPSWVHPTAAGYQKLVGPFFDHISRYL